MPPGVPRWYAVIGRPWADVPIVVSPSTPGIVLVVVAALVVAALVVAATVDVVDVDVVVVDVGVVDVGVAATPPDVVVLHPAANATTSMTEAARVTIPAAS